MISKRHIWNLHKLTFISLITEYFRFCTSSSSKTRSRSHWEKGFLHNKWSQKVLLESCWYCASFKRQQDSSAFRRRVWEYFVVEWRNIWWHRGICICFFSKTEIINFQEGILVNKTSNLSAYFLDDDHKLTTDCQNVNSLCPGFH